MEGSELLAKGGVKAKTKTLALGGAKEIPV